MVAIGALVAVAGHAARAQSTATGPGGQTLTVSSAADLDPSGTTVQVTGSGYDPDKGIYVSFCVVPLPGELPTPCGGGIDLTGSGGGTVWVSSNPPVYATGLTTPYGPGGTFDVALTVHAALDETIDCRQIACAVVTRNDHGRSGDRSQDVIVPVTFAGAAPSTTAGASAAPVPTDPVTGCGPSTAVVDANALDPLTPQPIPMLPVTVHSADGRDVTVTDVSRILPVNLYGSIGGDRVQPGPGGERGRP